MSDSMGRLMSDPDLLFAHLGNAQGRGGRQACTTFGPGLSSRNA